MRVGRDEYGCATADLSMPGKLYFPETSRP
jgi:hypothetical protein